ncbi:MAG: hypothetical protein ACYCPR_05295 [Thermoplasmataceae archaeon]
MPFKDPARQAEYMRKKRAEKKAAMVNTVNAPKKRKPVNPISLTEVAGDYENGYWIGVCPTCNMRNKIDPGRSFRPVEICEHFQQLQRPGKPSSFMFKARLTHKSVNPVNPSVNPRRYLLSYSRNKYQFVLYSLDIEGKRSLLKSYHKDETLDLGNIKIRLTWGPDLESIEEASK